eukprot:gene10061-7188_t
MPTAGRLGVGDRNGDTPASSSTRLRIPSLSKAPAEPMLPRLLPWALVPGR